MGDGALAFTPGGGLGGDHVEEGGPWIQLMPG